MDKTKLLERLKNAEIAKAQLESAFQQALGQITLLKELIKEIEKQEHIKKDEK